MVSIDHIVESSVVMLEEGVFYNQRVLLGKLLTFALLHLYSMAKLAHYSRYLLTSFFFILVPCDEKDMFFWC